MTHSQKDIELTQKVVAILDDVLATGDWEASLFLKTRAKRLQKLRQEGLEILQEHGLELDTDSKSTTEHNQTGMVTLYISVYQADGNNMQKWYSTLKSISEQGISRPIYRDSDHVTALIRNKRDPKCEGYVSVLVNENAIMEGVKTITDINGNELIKLKQKALYLDNIMRFYHLDKEYVIRDGQLVSVV